MEIKFEQSFLVSAGEYGCLAICLWKIAKKVNDARGKATKCLYEALSEGISDGYIDFNEVDYKDKNNFFVREASKFVKKMTGLEVSYRWESFDYEVKNNEFEIDFWAKSKGDSDKGIGHFTLPGENTLQKSFTVDSGKIYNKRILKF